MEIYPSILETNLDEFITTLKKLLPVFNHFQIDIADGIFVPNKTIQIEEIMSVVNGQLSNVKGKSYEFHLMVKDYEKEIAKLKHLKPLSVLIHLRSIAKLLNGSIAKKISRQFNNEAMKQWQYGLVLSPDDEVQKNYPIISQFPIIQIMTVNPGRQGSPFLPQELKKINELREAGFKGKIILDGGINDQTLSIILKNKHLPDAVAPGSYFTKAAGPAQNLAKLRSILGP